MESSDYEVNRIEVASGWANAVAEFGSILNRFDPQEDERHQQSETHISLKLF